MQGRFQTYPDSSQISEHPSRFGGDGRAFVADSFGDPIFLEDSWTAGLAAAIDNQDRRRKLKTNCDDQARNVRELDNLGTLGFIEDREAAATQDTAPSGWTPQDWFPEDRIAQSWIPQGWTPPWSQQQPGTFTDRCDVAMTTERACMLLEVTPASTREQVRSAYRRMVGHWHPDRLQFTTDAVRNHATDHMAALNEAYRLLCATLLEEAA